LEFGLLGPLLVRRDGKVAVVRRGHQRTLLTVLLLNANRAVTVNDIADILWDAAPPPSAQVTIRNYVKRLRQALGDADRTRISSQPRGYMITVSDGEMDVPRCEALLGAARASARDDCWDQAAAQARAALSLWRGEPLADVESDVLVLREVPRLAEMHLQALEVRIDAEVHLGRHDEVIVELQRLTKVYPLREQFHILLMLALYRGGQQGEALAAYQHARRLLAEDLGVEPGAEMRTLHQQMLSADPALNAPERARPAPGSAVYPVPRELPAAPVRFTGRAAELAVLTSMLDQAGTKALVISAIGGMAGVGKTNPRANTSDCYRS
jgi:DNA-binding SARP family transcriptional activator